MKRVERVGKTYCSRDRPVKNFPRESAKYASKTKTFVKLRLTVRVATILMLLLRRDAVD